MKVFQVIGGICYWDATSQFPTKESTIGFFPPEDLFVEAPDTVFTGWGYVDGKFLKPEAPEGWLYDEESGTFYPEGEIPSQVQSTPTATWEQMAIAIREGANRV